MIPSRRTFVAGLLAGTVDIAFAQPAPKSAAEASSVAHSIVVQARPLESFSTAERGSHRVGSLLYRGGLVLTSKDRDFGGLSSIRMQDAGATFVSVTDRGNWVTGRVVSKNGVPTALTDVVLAPLINSDGRPLIHSRRWYDSEALAMADGIAYVSFERVHQIMRFDFGASGIHARGEPVQVPPEMRALPANKGVEALVVAPPDTGIAGALIGFSETAVSAGHHAGFIIGGPQPGLFRLRHSNDYDVTDAALLPGGNEMLILERKWSVLSGVAARIRRVSVADILPTAVVDGPVIFEADMGYEIDNFEGIDVHQEPTGHTVVTLVSDDNFSIIQRTLFLQFTLVE
jgi:hypothetical protein